MKKSFLLCVVFVITFTSVNCDEENVVVEKGEKGKIENVKKVSNSTTTSSSKIVHGIAASATQFPYQVMIRSFNTGNTVSVCGGSILSDRFVLTAAHCTKNYKHFEIGFGSTHASQPLYRMKATSVIVHEHFDQKLLSNDIAIIRLPVNILFGRTVSTVQLPSRSQSLKSNINTRTTVSGYGRTSDSASHVSHILNYVDMRVIQAKECVSVFGSKIVTRNVLCAKGWANARDNACLGDSGGPMTVDINRQPVQIGIVSFVSSRGCTYGDPSGYTNVGRYIDWISRHTGIKIRP